MQTNQYNPSPEILYGRNPVFEALNAHHPIEKIFVQFGIKSNALEQIKFLAKQQGILCAEVSQQRLKELSEGKETQGVVALVSARVFVEVDDLLNVAKEKGEKPFLLILDEIEDPQNLGAIIRTAECCGVHGIIIPKHHSASLSSAVAKSSAGAIEYMNVAKVTNIVSTIEELKTHGLWIIGTSDDATTGYTDYDYTAPVAIVIGNEGKGIRKLVKERCDVLVKIPMRGKISSLNASVAAGVLLYEVVRKRMWGK
ncbi:MAG: 23S rRNA (guanosine(2251)-2'-O)-methyltransferase RlmB [Ignavibacteriales bacterium]|nr:23S rRNA (guanosine(2251)-2'-O)-methyltransferase RlmB [Ignavibacteriales bacterium]